MNVPTNVFDVKTGLEAGIVNLLGLTFGTIAVGTRETYPQNFQQIRPRIDVKGKINSHTGRRSIRPSTGTQIFDGWSFDIALNAVTALSHDGLELTHTQLCQSVRELMAEAALKSWSDLANFPLHLIAEPVKESGSQNTTDTKGNFEYTAIGFVGILIIRPGINY
jgi:hypothetical protein